MFIQANRLNNINIINIIKFNYFSVIEDSIFSLLNMEFSLKPKETIKENCVGVVMAVKLILSNPKRKKNY